ncbi:MAG: hypothetical protein ACLRZZ_05940 [Enterocloster sp.]
MFDDYGLELPRNAGGISGVLQSILRKTELKRRWSEPLVAGDASCLWHRPAQDLYNGGNTEAEVAALNSGERKYSDYMRPGFAFRRELTATVDILMLKKRLSAKAIEVEGPDFVAQKNTDCYGLLGRRKFGYCLWSPLILNRRRYPDFPAAEWQTPVALGDRNGNWKWVRNMQKMQCVRWM